jgi:hypothetical protein
MLRRKNISMRSKSQHLRVVASSVKGKRRITSGAKGQTPKSMEKIRTAKFIKEVIKETDKISSRYIATDSGTWIDPNISSPKFAYSKPKKFEVGTEIKVDGKGYTITDISSRNRIRGVAPTKKVQKIISEVHKRIFQSISPRRSRKRSKLRRPHQ